MLYSIFPENVSSRPRMGGLDFGTPYRDDIDLLTSCLFLIVVVGYNSVNIVFVSCVFYVCHRLYCHCHYLNDNKEEAMLCV